MRAAQSFTINDNVYVLLGWRVHIAWWLLRLQASWRNFVCTTIYGSHDWDVCYDWCRRCHITHERLMDLPVVLL